MEASTPAGGWQHQQLCSPSTSTLGPKAHVAHTSQPASCPFLTTCQGQIKGFTLLKPKGIYGLRQSTAQLWSECASALCGRWEHLTEVTAAIMAAFLKADTKEGCSCSHHVVRFRKKAIQAHSFLCVVGLLLRNLRGAKALREFILIPYFLSSSTRTWCCTSEALRQCRTPCTPTYFNTNYGRNGTTWF